MADTFRVDWNGISGGAFWLVLISLVFYVVGMSTVGWATNTTYKFQVGLWDACQCGMLPSSPSWLKATQAMIILGGLCLFAGFVLGFLYLFVERFKNSKMMIAIISVLGVSVLFSLIGFIVFGVESASLSSPYNVSLSYSYAFTVIGTIGATAACILSVVHWRKNKTFS